MKFLNAILSEGESYTTEFKESADKSLAVEVCAFANASGGRIFIGVDDHGRIVGTEVGNSARSRIQDTINQVEPRLKVDIATQGKVIIVTVPEGMNKPYSCSKGFYLRSGPNSQKLERDDIIAFFQSEGRVRYDEIIRDDLPITERFDPEAYKRYVRLANISDVLERDTLLKNLGCAAVSGGKLCFTNLGALFFRVNGEDVAFRHAGVVAALYKGVDKVDILDVKEFNGGIVANVDDAMVFLKKHLRVSYRIKTLQREEILELPEDALREAVVNAVCHRDYFEKGARVMVEVFDDRVDITNPGGLCKGVTRENFGTVSITRNPNLASMLCRVKYIEQMGTGILRMKKMTREAKVAEPSFDFSGFFKITFPRIPSPPSTPRSANGGVRGIEVGSNGSEVGSEVGSDLGTEEQNREAKILSALKQNPKFTLLELTHFTQIPTRSISRILRFLRKNNTIKRIGPNYSGHWEFTQNPSIQPMQTAADDGRNCDANCDANCGVNFGVNCGINCGINCGVHKTKTKIVDLMTENPKTTVGEMAKSIKTSKRNLEYHIRELKKTGIVERIGANKNGHWVVKGSKSKMLKPPAPGSASGVFRTGVCNQ